MPSGVTIKNYPQICGIIYDGRYSRWDEVWAQLLCCLEKYFWAKFESVTQTPA